MKKLFFFALASMALASCSQDDEFVAEKSNNEVKNTRGGIAFSTYTAGATRADVATSVSVKKFGFNVRAAYNGMYYIANNKVDFTATDNVYDTQDETYYWPVDIAADRAMRFYAFNVVASDATSATAAGTQAEWVDAKTSTTDDGATLETNSNQIKFTVEENNAADQLDLVVATATAKSMPSEGVQPLNFVHALSKINFSLKSQSGNADETYYVRKIELVANTGEAIATLTTQDSDAPNRIDNDEHVDGVVTWAAPTTTDGIVIPDGTTGAIFDNTQGQDVEQATTGKTYVYFEGVASSETDLAKWNATDNTGKPVAESDGDHFGTTTGANCVSFAGDETLKLDYNLMLFPKASTATVSDVVAIRVYYMVVDDNKPAGQKVLGNCGYYPTKPNAGSSSTNTIYGCKTIKLAADWEPGYAYRYTLALPLVSFTGDKDGDLIADDQDLNDETGKKPGETGYTTANNKDIDLDGDESESEFNEPTKIRFSVTVSKWATETDQDVPFYNNK